MKLRHFLKPVQNVRSIVPSQGFTEDFDHLPHVFNALHHVVPHMFNPESLSAAAIIFNHTN